jgi:hypothetical protein
MEHVNDTLAKLKDSLNEVHNAIEKIALKPAEKPEFLNNEISGDKIHGGRITQFSSVGIKDDATKQVVAVKDDGLYTEHVYLRTLRNKDGVQVLGGLDVQGSITAKSLHVDEITADVRNERSSSLEFVPEGTAGFYGKGLVWKGDGPTRQFVYRANPDRIWTSESIDLDRGSAYKIDNIDLLTVDSLGSSIRNSSLTTVGTLNNLRTAGNLSIDEFIIYDADSQRLGIGTDAPNGNISIASYETEFVIDVESEFTKVGNWTTDDLHIITDNTTRITVKANGKVDFGRSGRNDARVSVFGKLGVGVNNVSDGVSIASANAIEIAGTKIMTGTSVPDNGTFRQGDIMYNTNAVPTGYVGWVCVRDGTPGEWKPFGKISS